MKKMKKCLLAIFAILFLSAVWIWWGNCNIEVNEITIEADVPDGFSGYRIAVVSDLHNARFGKDNEKLIKRLKGTGADIIVITGDMIDSRNTNIPVAIAVGEKSADIAPVYYVNGNHEARIGSEYEKLKEGLTKAGVTVMENAVIDISMGNDTITLIGLNDTGFDFNTGIDYQLNRIMPDNDNYKILLAHRPEYFDKYEGVDLVLSGHAHGGQIRLPLVGGLFAPGQGLMPKYDAGIFTEGGKTMVVSRGLGNSLFPFRVNNNPEIVVVELMKN